MNSQNLQILKAGYGSISSSSVLSPGAGQQILLHTISVFNGGPAACDLAIGIKLNPEGLILEQHPALTQISSGNIFTTTTNDGFLVNAKTRFDQVSFVVSQAPTGSPVYEYMYWNGSAYASLQILNAPNYAVGQNHLVFNAPNDWAVDGSGYYKIRARATTAPGQVVTVSSYKVIKHIAFRPDVGNNQQLRIRFTTKSYLLEGLEEIVPYFEVADARNMVEISYQLNN